VAPAYETYLFSKLVFRWVPECGTSTAGSVYIAIDYDPTDYPPNNLRDLMSMESAVSGSVWSILKHASKISNLRKMKTYFTSPLFGGDAERTTSVGSLFLTRGRNPTVGAPLGKLFVDYSIELMTPQPEDPASFALAFRDTSGSTPTPFGSLNSQAGHLPYGVVNNYTIVLPNSLEGVLLVNTQTTAPGAPTYTAAVDSFGGFRVWTTETEDGYLQIILFSVRSHGVGRIEYHTTPDIFDVKSFFMKLPCNLFNWTLSNMDRVDVVPWSPWLDPVRSTRNIKQYSNQVEYISG